MLMGVKGKKNCTGQVSMENAYLNKNRFLPCRTSQSLYDAHRHLDSVDGVVPSMAYFPQTSYRGTLLPMGRVHHRDWFFFRRH